MVCIVSLARPSLKERVWLARLWSAFSLALGHVALYHGFPALFYKHIGIVIFSLSLGIQQTTFHRQEWA